MNSRRTLCFNVMESKTLSKKIFDFFFFFFFLFVCLFASVGYKQRSINIVFHYQHVIEQKRYFLLQGHVFHIYVSYRMTDR